VSLVGTAVDVGQCRFTCAQQRPQPIAALADDLDRARDCFVGRKRLLDLFLISSGSPSRP
jgi:hypothetical protein